MFYLSYKTETVQQIHRATQKFFYKSAISLKLDTRLVNVCIMQIRLKRP